MLLHKCGRTLTNGLYLFSSFMLSDNELLFDGNVFANLLPDFKICFS